MFFHHPSDRLLNLPRVTYTIPPNPKNVPANATPGNTETVVALDVSTSNTDPSHLHIIKLEINLSIGKLDSKLTLLDMFE